MVRRFRACLDRECGHERGIAVADFSGGGNLIGRHQFAAGRDVQDARARRDEWRGFAELGAERKLGGAEASPAIEEHAALARIFATAADVCLRVALRERDPVAVSLRELLHEHLRRTIGYGRAREDSRAFARLDRAHRQRAGGNFAHDAELRRRIVRTDRVAIHRRAIECRDVLLRSDRLAQRAAMRLREPDAERRQDMHGLCDERAGFGDAEHACVVVRTRRCGTRKSDLLAHLQRTRYEARMIQVKLLAFAQAADRLGWREILAECAPDETLRGIVGRNAPGFDFTSVCVAVDCEYMSWDDAVGALAQEIAIIPPVSGG